MHILLTGSTGFIGSRLAHHLVHHGHTLSLITRPNSDLSALQSITNRLANHLSIYPYDGSYDSLLPAFNAKPVDCVIHLAAFSQFTTTPHEMTPMIDANITLGSLLLEAMLAHGCTHFINTGTFSQHKSSALYEPCCFYASTKEAFSTILDYYCTEHQFKALTLKLTDSYGPNDPRPKLFNQLRSAYQAGKTLDMTPGEQTIYLTHVDDIANAYKIGLSTVSQLSPGDHTQYFIAGQGYTLKDIVSRYCTLTRQNISINWGGLDYRPSQIMLPFIGEILPGWKPTISLEDGLQHLKTNQH